MNDDKQQKVEAVGDREIRIERVFNAPRDRVFAAFTDPELIPRWWGPRQYTTRVEKMDVRPGGEWHFVHEGGNEEDNHGFRGEYREVTPPERLVQTFEWLGMPGHIAVETAAFEDLGERTRLVTTSVFDSTEDRDGMIASGMESGLSETYERLDEVLAEGN
jgi:uncharacterized protein YndB with AHSA1/START domain